MAWLIFEGMIFCGFCGLCIRNFRGYLISRISSIFWAVFMNFNQYYQNYHTMLPLPPTSTSTLCLCHRNASNLQVYRRGVIFFYKKHAFFQRNLFKLGLDFSNIENLNKSPYSYFRVFFYTKLDFQRFNRKLCRFFLIFP